MSSNIANSSNIGGNLNESSTEKTLALFVSDLHLELDRPKTTASFLSFLSEQAAHADSLYILGDLFEAWAGDDELADNYINSIVEAIRSVSLAGCQVFWVPGNRDFLTGANFLVAVGATFLEEPAVQIYRSLKLVVLHGDAQCTDDIPYMNFRRVVREDSWRKQFLSLSFESRRKMVADVRKKSLLTQKSRESFELADVNIQVIDKIFENTGADFMIHGHTHRPNLHTHSVLGRTCVRMVLPDWDLDDVIERGGWIGLGEDEVFRCYDFSGHLLSEFRSSIQSPI